MAVPHGADPYKQFLAAVLLQCFLDLHSPDPAIATDAEGFLDSEAYEHYCTWLQLDPGRGRRNRLALARGRVPLRARHPAKSNVSPRNGACHHQGPLSRTL